MKPVRNARIEADFGMKTVCSHDSSSESIQSWLGSNEGSCSAEATIDRKSQIYAKTQHGSGYWLGLAFPNDLLSLRARKTVERLSAEKIYIML